MPSNGKTPSFTAGFGKVKLLRSRFERKDAGAQRAEFKWDQWIKHRNQYSFSVHSFPEQHSDKPDISDSESLFDHIFSSHRKELPGQSACATQAIRKFYGSRPPYQTEADEIEPSDIQPSNKGCVCPTSNAPTRSDHELESFFNKDEIGAIGDIIWDQPSIYAEVWINNAHFVFEPSHDLENLGTGLGAVYGVIATLTGFQTTVDDLEPCVQEGEGSHSEDDSDLTPRASYKNCPGYFVPAPEADAASNVADDGSCFSYGVESHHESLFHGTPTPSLRGYALSISSEIDHTEHPAFRATAENNNNSVLTTKNESYSIHNVKIHDGDLLDESSVLGVRGFAPLYSAEIDHTKHPAFHNTVDQESRYTRESSTSVASGLPALFGSDEEGERRGVPGLPTGPCFTSPDSPTLGGNAKPNTWYSCSLSPSEEEFLSEEAPTLAPLHFTSFPTEYANCIGNEISRSSCPQSCCRTDPYLQVSSPSRGNIEFFPSQQEVQDGGADFMYDGGLDEESDEKLYDDLDEWFADGRENEQGIEDDGIMGDGAGDPGFSDAFLSSPLCLSKDQHSLRKSMTFEPLPEYIDDVGSAKPTQGLGDALDNEDTATCNDIATSASNDKAEVSADSFGTLGKYRQKEVPKVFESCRASSPDIPLAHGSPYEARPVTRPTTPTDREVNRYLQKTARPIAQTSPKGRRKTNQSYELDHAPNTTPSLDQETPLERIDTFASTFDLEPRTTPLSKKLAQKVSLSVVTSNQPSPPMSPSTPKTPMTTPTKKKFRFTGSWGRKGGLPTELRNGPYTVRGPELMCSPGPQHSPAHRDPLAQTSYALPPSPRSPSHTSPMTQYHYPSPPQRTAPSTPMDELPPIPPRDPRRLAVKVCNTSFPEMQRESIAFFNQLDPNSQKFYAEQKLNKLRELTNTRIVYRNMSDPRTEYMKHPNHNRVWGSHNLRCRVHEGNCAVCKEACCVHRSAEQTVKDISNLPEEKRYARKLLVEIHMWYKMGDEPTFIVCSSCEKKVCPRHAGVCAVCEIITCKTCKPTLWRICDHH